MRVAGRAVENQAEVPARLKLVGEVAAGHPFRGSLGVGETARIFTGGVIPAGADTIVIQENTIREKSAGGGNTVVVTVGASSGRHVRVAGLDFARGAVLLAKGRRLSDRDLALAAAMNHPTVPVHRRPRLAVVATGDELVMPGSAPGFGEIVYSNGYATMAMARRELAFEQVQRQRGESAGEEGKRIALALVVAGRMQRQRERRRGTEIVHIERMARAGQREPPRQFGKAAGECRPRCQPCDRAIAIDQQARLLRSRARVASALGRSPVSM